MTQPKQACAIDVFIRCARRVPMYFLMVAPVVGVLAGVQFLLLSRMPGWEAIKTPSAFMTNLMVHPAPGMVVCAQVHLVGTLPSSVERELVIINADIVSIVDRLRVNHCFMLRSSPCGKFFSSVSDQHQILVGQVAQPDRLHVVELDHSNACRDMSWSPDSQRLILLSADKLYLWDRPTRSMVAVIDVDDDARIASPKGGPYFGILNGNTYQQISWDTGQIARSTSLETQSGFVSLATNHSRLAYQDQGRLYVLDMSTQLPLLKEPYQIPMSAPNGFALSEDGNRLAFIDEQGDRIVVIEVSPQAVTASLPIESELAGLQLCAGYLWAWTIEGTIYRWNLADGSRQPISLVTRQLLPKH